MDSTTATTLTSATALTSTESEIINKRMQYLQYQVNSAQGRLEGLFRQCYTACTQLTFAARIDMYANMLDHVNDTVELIQNDIAEFEGLKAELQRREIIQKEIEMAKQNGGNLADSCCKQEDCCKEPMQ